MKGEAKEFWRNKLAMILMRDHIGRGNAIGMGELYETLFGEPWENRINDTRHLRTLITELRREGLPICSVCCSLKPGYYLAAAGSEREEYCGRLRKQGLKKLDQEARVRKLALPEVVQQVLLNLQEAG